MLAGLLVGEFSAQGTSLAPARRPVETGEAVLPGPTDDTLPFVTAPAPCASAWMPTFGGHAGVRGPTFPRVEALSTLDVGSGPDLYAGGEFQSAGGLSASNVARWDGERWSALGSGTDGTVHALAVFDDGSGPALYAGGEFTVAGGVGASHIARWDGSSWSPLGTGTNNFVWSLATHDDGNGPKLYVGGFFNVAGGVVSPGLAAWNGSSWEAVGGGLAGTAFALATFDDGRGPALYAGGNFSAAGGFAAARVARWDGSTWEPLGSGVNNTVFALAAFEGVLYVGGAFTSAGSTSSRRIAAWNGGHWSGAGTLPEVKALAVVDVGDGPALHAGGDEIARWDGLSWTTLGTHQYQAMALIGHDDGSGPALYVGGRFLDLDNVRVYGIARRDGTAWKGLGGDTFGFPKRLVMFDDGGGPRLHVGGLFWTQGGSAEHGFARWDHGTWTDLSSGLSPNTLTCLQVFDEGGGPTVFAAGVDYVSRLDGTSWTFLGRVSSPKVMAVFDDGAGPKLYLAGYFSRVDSLVVQSIACWDGTAWSPPPGGGFNLSTVRALQAFDDGTGSKLYAGGFFFSAGGVPAQNVARWDGSTWEPVGNGLPLTVFDFEVFDDGSGPALHAASWESVYRWDGTDWIQRGPDFDSFVRTLAVFDDGQGPALFAAGEFTLAGGLPARRVARWSGTRWTGLGKGVNGQVEALVALDDGCRPSLVVAGSFTLSPSGDSGLARWGCVRLDGNPPRLDLPDLVEVVGATGGEVVVPFTVTAVDDQDPCPTIVCTPPSGSSFPIGTTIVRCTATDASGNRATGQFPVTVGSLR